MDQCNRSASRRKVGSQARSRSGVRRVNLSHLALVLDPHGRRGDRDEQAPPCPECRSAAHTLWFVDRRTGRPELVCLSCTRYEPTTEFPETEPPAGAVTKHLTAGEFPRLA